MNSTRSKLKLQSFLSTWLVITSLAVLCLFCCDHTSAAPIADLSKPSAEDIAKVDDQYCLNWMEKYKMRKPGQAVNFTTMIAKIQYRAGIEITGKLDDETKKLFVIPRCGVSEKEDEPQISGVESRRKKRYTLQGTRWRNRDLTYRFLSHTPDLPVALQENILRRMINKWAEVSTLTIREQTDPSVPDDDVEILISFVRRYHGDPYAFDGPGGTLAHAYYPHHNRGLSGDAHFDDDETYTTETSQGINLDWVAVHEFGHSMGLEHSNVRESIMYPWYKGYFPNIELTRDDILGIQALYGKPVTTTSPPTTTKAPTTTEATTKPTTKATTTEATTKATTKPTTKATTAEPTTKATTKATTAEPTTKATTKATTAEPTTKATTKPTTKATTTEPTTKATTKATTQTVTEKPTTSPQVVDVCKVSKFDAFMMGADGRTYVFSGDDFWVLSINLRIERGPVKIKSKWRELQTPINSVYTNLYGRTVFFKGSQYWKYYGYILEEGPRDIRQFGLPPDLRDPNAAFVWGGNRKTYFFKGNNYWRYNEFKKAVDANYPRSISVWGLPHRMDSAMTWTRNGRTYFFRDGIYWKLNDGTLQLVNGYPRDTTANWMRCFN